MNTRARQFVAWVLVILGGLLSIPAAVLTSLVLISTVWSGMWGLGRRTAPSCYSATIPGRSGNPSSRLANEKGLIANLPRKEQRFGRNKVELAIHRLEKAVLTTSALMSSIEKEIRC